MGIESNDSELDFSGQFAGLSFTSKDQDFDKSNLARLPFVHQEQGIRWLLAHFNNIEEYRSGGALLADDMGLGKTFMTLVAIGERTRREESAGLQPKPTLIIAPLSLLENWRDEVHKTFKEIPFQDLSLINI